MGYLKNRYGFELLGKTPTGTCPVCGVAHDPEFPHNRDSLVYMYKFYDEHGRWPSWEDAMSHCSTEMKNMWRVELANRGVDVTK